MPRIYYKAEGTKFVLGMTELANRGRIVLLHSTAKEVLTAWSYGRDGTISPTFDTTLVIDSNPTGGTVTGEQPFVLNTRSATASQKWRYEPSSFTFRNVQNPGIVIDLRDRKVQEGNTIWTYKQNGTPAQQWNPEPPPLPLTGQAE